ncbi:MAG: hypothetical protein LUE88_06425, partial [Clostridiales bacterium]|nr:hypothetical protein [Clostridiales bacterium]
DVFYTDCVNFLTGSEDIHQLREYTSQLLKCMPMRMARGRFFDIVLRSLRAAFDGESEDCITKSLEAFKRGCAPSLSEDYGKIFPEIAEWLASKKEINPTRLDDETLYSEYEDFGIMLDSINDVEDYITSIYNELSSLIIVFYLTFSFDELTEKSIVYSDLYHTVVDMMTGEISKEEAEPMYETLLDQLGDAFEPLIDKVNDINEKETKLIEKIHDTSKLSEDTLKSISAEGFIRGVYYTTLDDVIFNFDIDENSPVASKEFSEKAFNDFIEYIQEYYKTLQPNVRKANMLTLLGAIPVSMDIPDTIDYVKSSIAACIDEEQKMRIVDNVGRVFTSNGFKYVGEDDEDDDECDCHDHHHHDHDCECHDHHHNHDCDCHDHSH